MKRRQGKARWLTAALAWAGAVAACSPRAQSGAESGDTGVHPRLLYTAAHRDRLIARQTQEPYATIWKRLRDMAARPARAADPGTWSTDVWGDNALVAQANAILAWALGDADAAAKARQLLLSFESNFEDSRELDADIHLARVLVPYANAWDLLAATPWLSASDSRDARDRITTVARKFVAQYLDQPLYRTTELVLTQKNHPLRAASTLGYVALAFPDDPDAPRWRDWSVDQMDYLLGPKGHYVQADGGVVEGPFYHAFGFSAVVPYLIALDRNEPADAVYHHTCVTRNSVDPWSDNGCIEGEPFTFRNPLHDPLFASSVDWSIALRRPSGVRAQLDDANMTALNGAALLTAYGGAPHLLWDWQTNDYLAFETEKFNDLTAWYLAYVEDIAPAEPPFRNRFFPDAGQAVFRSGWGTKDRWLTLVADHGAARKSLHNHADGTSFSLSAYGEDLLIDTGYYKPNDKRNPLTMDAPSHNVVLVDGIGAPTRGLLNDWGDTDAFLENTRDGDRVAWAEGRIAYQGVEIRRGVAFARQRYFVVADRIRNDGTVASPAPRTFQWRAHLWAGHDAGGAYAIAGNRVTVDRANAGILVAAGTTAGAPAFVEPAYTPLTPPHVHSVDGTAGDHAVVDATIRAIAPGYLVVLAPYAAGGTGEDAPLVVTEIATEAGGVAWSVASGTFHDVAWLRGDGAPTSLALPGGHLLATDAAFVLVSTAGEYALVAGGSALSLDGRALVTGNAEPVTIVTP